MDAIEKAVRNALEKGDAEDKNFRRRVYVSARHALEKSMAGKKLSQKLADEKFSRLSEVAAAIESEFSEATEPEDYQSLGRRSYEAAAPLVDDVAEQAVPDAELAGIGGEERPLRPAVEQMIEAADELPAPFEQVTWEEDANELPPVTPEKSAKPAKKPGGRKKTVKKTVVEEIPAVAEPAAPGPDLFEETEPAWDEVSLPATYDAESAGGMDAQAEMAAEAESEAPSATPLSPMADPLLAHDLESGEPGDDSQQDLEDLHNIDGVSIEESGSFAETEPALPEEESAAPALSDENIADQRFEVRPASIEAADEENLPARQMHAASAPKRGWAFLFILITLLAFFVMALWIAFSTGALKMRGAVEETSVETVTVAPVDQPAPPAVAPAPASASDDWLMIFRPDNPGDLVVDPTIKADINGQGPLARLRIEPAPSTTGDEAVVFSIGEGILQQVAGKKAVFDIVAAADKGKPTQVSVLCDFAGLGDCGRKRYQIDDATSDNLFQIEFPAGRPQGAGQIILNPDVDGKGRALEIYAIKVRVAN